MFRRPAWLCLHYASCVVTDQNATFWGVAHPGGGLSHPNSNSAEIFVRCIYAQSFIILCLLVRKLSCWQAHRPTNRFRRKHPTFFARQRRRVNSTTYSTLASRLSVHSTPVTDAVNTSLHKRKDKEEYLCSAILTDTTRPSAQTWITEFYLQITPCLHFLRKRSPDGATLTEVADILIAAYY